MKPKSWLGVHLPAPKIRCPFCGGMMKPPRALYSFLSRLPGAKITDRKKCPCCGYLRVDYEYNGIHAIYER